MEIAPQKPAAPVPPKNWPTLWWAIRHIRELGNNIALWPQECYEADFIARQFRGRMAVVVNHPELIKHVLVTNSSNYPKSAEANAVLIPLLGKGQAYCFAAPSSARPA